MTKKAASPSSDRDPESVWFGFQPIDPKEKTKRVGEVFSSVATHYDLMNDLMSAGMHRLWKDHLVARMHPQAGQNLLDLAGGTGDIALRLAAKTDGAAHITVCDINPAMLAVGRAKAQDKGFLTGLDWVVGNAEALPFEDRSMDMVSIAFGLRNVTHIDAALAEAARVLKRGGRFYCMEFTSGVAKPLKKIFDFYCSTAMPFLGRHVANDEESYRYLAESIQRFPDQKTLALRMQRAGFDVARYENLMGGMAVIHTGWVL